MLTPKEFAIANEDDFLSLPIVVILILTLNLTNIVLTQEDFSILNKTLYR
jgi:hypothetical protein